METLIVVGLAVLIATCLFALAKLRKQQNTLEIISMDIDLLVKVAETYLRNSEAKRMDERMEKRLRERPQSR